MISHRGTSYVYCLPCSCSFGAYPRYLKTRILSFCLYRPCTQTFILQTPYPPYPPKRPGVRAWSASPGQNTTEWSETGGVGARGEGKSHGWISLDPTRSLRRFTVEKAYWDLLGSNGGKKLSPLIWAALLGSRAKKILLCARWIE